MYYIYFSFEAFNGNKDKVTIFGNSAGAASVDYHTLSGQSKGLFNQAIMQVSIISILIKVKFLFLALVKSSDKFSLFGYVLVLLISAIIFCVIVRVVQWNSAGLRFT